MSLRPTFMGFETATRGIMINQKALDIIGNNLSNLDTTGYTRQRVDTASMAVNFRNTRYAAKNAMAGQGASVVGISQIRDEFLDRRFREEFADVGYYDKSHEVLSDIEGALNEIEPSTVTQALEKFRDSWAELLEDGSSSVGASHVYAAAKSMAQVFNQINKKLDQVWEQQKYDLDSDVGNINKMLEQVAYLNDSIKREMVSASYSNGGYYGPNELIDQRNVLLDKLSNCADIQVFKQDDGSVTVNMGGKEVVKGNSFDSLNVIKGRSDQTLRVIWNSSGEDMQATSGSLRSSLEMLNGRGLESSPSRGEVTDNGILYYKDKIDQFARVLADAFNNVIEIKPDPANPGAPKAYKQLFSFGSDPLGGAGSIQVTDDWTKDNTYITKNVVQDGPKDASYAHLAQGLFTSEKHDFGEFQGSFHSYIIFYDTTRLGAGIDYSKSRLESCEDISDTLLNRIASVSGVSMDEEAVDSMMYKKAYDAVSRVMTTMDDMLDKLINGTGRVGL